LTNVVTAITGHWGKRHGEISTRVVNYAEMLYLQHEWMLAADVFRTFAGFASTESDCGLLPRAWHRVGMCESALSHFAEAEHALTIARDLAAQRDDTYTVLAAEHGLALTVARRGNFPDADVRFADIIRRCEMHLVAAPGVAAVLAKALQDAGGVALQLKDTDRAFALLGRALAHAPDVRDKERVLHDIGVVFLRLDIFDVARDTLQFVESHAQDETIRWVASLNLMHLATRQGSDIDFARHRRCVANIALPPRLSIDYHLYLGQEWERVGQPDRAQRAFQRAQDLGEQYGLNAQWFEAEDALTQLASRLDRIQRREVAAGLIETVEHTIAHLSAALVGTGA
jgi:tetratricopeptide (TPR) repeat protein